MDNLSAAQQVDLMLNFHWAPESDVTSCLCAGCRISGVGQAVNVMMALAVGLSQRHEIALSVSPCGFYLQ